MENKSLGISSKEFGVLFNQFNQAIKWYMKHPESGDQVKVIISADVYDELKKYCKEVNEPISMVATKAIKQYVNL